MQADSELVALGLRHEEREDGSDKVAREAPPLQCWPDTADDLSHLVAALGPDGAEGAAAVGAVERLAAPNGIIHDQGDEPGEDDIDPGPWCSPKQPYETTQQWLERMEHEGAENKPPEIVERPHCFGERFPPGFGNKVQS